MSDSTISIRLFSVLREVAGTDRVEIEASGLRTVGDTADSLFGRMPPLARYRPVVRFARNREYVDATEPVEPGDEIALITPVSGG